MLCFASNNLAICIKLPRNLRQIRIQSASNRTVISVILGGKVTEITLQEERNEGIEAIKRLHRCKESGFSFLFGHVWKC